MDLVNVMTKTMMCAAMLLVGCVDESDAPDEANEALLDDEALAALEADEADEADEASDAEQAAGRQANTYGCFFASTYEREGREHQRQNRGTGAMPGARRQRAAMAIRSRTDARTRRSGQ